MGTSLNIHRIVKTFQLLSFLTFHLIFNETTLLSLRSLLTPNVELAGNLGLEIAGEDCESIIFKLIYPSILIIIACLSLILFTLA